MLVRMHAMDRAPRKQRSAVTSEVAFLRGMLGLGADQLAAFPLFW